MGHVAPTAVEVCFREKQRKNFFADPYLLGVPPSTPPSDMLDNCYENPDIQAMRRESVLYLNGQERYYPIFLWRTRVRDCGKSALISVILEAEGTSDQS